MAMGGLPPIGTVLPWFPTRSNIPTFFLTYSTILILHLARKAFASSKVDIIGDHWFNGYSSSGMGETQVASLLDTTFMVLYALGLIASATAADQYDPRLIITISMGASSVLVTIFGVMGYAGVHNVWAYLIVWGSHGLLQSISWPAGVSIMGHWFGPHKRGAVMGVWSSNANMGNLAASGLAALIFHHLQGQVAWSTVMFATGGLLLVGGAAVWLFLVPLPQQVGLPPYSATTPTRQLETPLLEDDGGGDATTTSGTSPITSPSGPPIGVIRALAIPGVLQYSLTYAGVKGVNYALLFWLPLFFKSSFENITDSKANLMSMFFDGGQVFGAFLGGYLCDWTGAPALTNLLMLLVAALALVFIPQASLFTAIGLLVLTGLMNGGPQNVIATAVSSDLGQHPSLLTQQGGGKALATVIAIVDVMGSIGAALVQLLVGRLTTCKDADGSGSSTTSCDWGWALRALALANALAAFGIIRLARQELPLLFHHPPPPPSTTTKPCPPSWRRCHMLGISPTRKEGPCSSVLCAAP